MSIFGWFKKHTTTTEQAPRAEDDMECSEKEVHTAALDLIWNERLWCENALWGGSLSECDRADANVARCRIKYAHCQPERIRKHIFQWLDFYDRTARENRADIISNASAIKAQKDDEAYLAKEARQAECSRRVAKNIRLVAETA